MNCGDTVRWTAGKEHSHEGIVVAVVPAHISAHRCVPAGFFLQERYHGKSRLHESYLIETAEGNNHNRWSLFWPFVSTLRVVREAKGVHDADNRKATDSREIQSQRP